MQTSAKRDTSLVDLYDDLEPRERYKFLRREERLRSRGVPLTFSYNHFQREEKLRMSSKKQKKNGNETKAGNFSMNMKRVNAKTPNQQETMDAYSDGFNLMLHGVAGTGKTFLSLYLGLKDVSEGKFQKIVIVRSVVPSRDMGFLPGSVKEKSAMYEAPYQAICSELFGRGDAYEVLKQKGTIEFVSTSHLRGTTLHNAIVLVDEFQNMNFQELDTVITRVGSGCRIIFSGDIEQSDLTKPHDKSGLPEFVKIVDEIWEEKDENPIPELCFVTIEFTQDDIVRSGIVKGYIKAKARLGLSQFLKPED
jgi:phosphate starvation-inducible protein PhoH